MIKLAFFVVRRPGLSAEQFREHAVNVHVPLLMKLPGLKKFVLNIRQPLQAPGQLEIDAMPELWFESMATFQQSLSGSPEGEAVQKDRAKFVDESKSQWVALDEQNII
jgi:uncharacterized protein (TIGR02118 family)